MLLIASAVAVYWHYSGYEIHNQTLRILTEQICNDSKHLNCVGGDKLECIAATVLPSTECSLGMFDLLSSKTDNIDRQEGILRCFERYHAKALGLETEEILKCHQSSTH